MEYGEGVKKESFAKRMREAMRLKDIKQVDLVEKTGLNKSAISQYYSGKFEPKQEGVYLIAKALNVNEAWLMGYDVPMSRIIKKYPNNVYKIEKKKYPLLGEIAAGAPIFAEEHYEGWVAAESDLHADFCVKVKGNSMINARIHNGDIVFIRKQPTVENGEIGAVMIGDEVTLKRVYIKNNQIILVSENPAYEPKVYKNEQLNDIRLLGKAVAVQSIL